MLKGLVVTVMVFLMGIVLVFPTSAAGDCAMLPSQALLKAALDAATATEISGLNNHMWATIVDRNGLVCGSSFLRAEQWGAMARQSRHFPQKANTGNAFSLDEHIGERRVRPIGGSGVVFQPTSTPRSIRAAVFMAFSIAIPWTPVWPTQVTRQSTE